MTTPGASIPADAAILFASAAKVQQKTMSYPPEGVLALTQDRRLVFLTRDGIVHDWPLAEIRNVTSPWYYLGEGFRFEAQGSKYSVYFNKISSTTRTGMLLKGTSVAGDLIALAAAAKGLMAIASARGLCSDWKSMLAATQQLPAPAANAV